MHFSRNSGFPQEFKFRKSYVKCDYLKDSRRNSREIIKEGVVNYIMLDSTTYDDIQHKWDKCRLVLVNSNDASMLEFYSPFKSFKPKCGLFCFLINEVRPTNPLEMPDRDFTFVLKSSNQMEYVIEAQSHQDMLEWLSSIKLYSAVNEATKCEISTSNGQTGQNVNKHIWEDTLKENHMLASIQKYPWFHRQISRSLAAQMVLTQGVSGHGVYLIRQSETRDGEFVLTFNNQGRAKHLRLKVKPNGQCSVEHFVFDSVFDLIEHFRIHSIPLESGSRNNNQEVILTEYIVNQDRIRVEEQIKTSNDSESNKMLAQKKQIITFGGSAQMTVQEVEQALRKRSCDHPLEKRTSSLDVSPNENSNQYQLV